MQTGSLEMTRIPLTLKLDSSAMYRNDLRKFKPADFTWVTRDEAQAAGAEAISRISAEGDRMGQIENKGRPVPELAAQRLEGRILSYSDIGVTFATPPSVEWSGGGVQIDYRPAVDLYL